MTTSTRCRAKGGPDRCTNPNCPAKRATKTDVFTAPARGGFGEPTGVPFYDLVDTPRFRQAAKEAVEKALDAYPAREQDWEAVSHAATLIREAYPAGSQALHMMDHNTGVLASWVRDRVDNEYDNRGVWADD